MNKTETGCLPSGWALTTLGEMADVVGGGTPDTRDASNYENGHIPWITPADLSGYTAKCISHGARFITATGLNGSGARMLPEGTVLFSSRAPIGYVVIAANSVCTNQGFKSFVLRPGMDSEYVYYYLKSAKDIATGLASGTTFLELSGAKAATIPMPVAPTNEQHRIVEEIEKQFSRLDAGVAALKRVQSNLKRYRAAVLRAACEGRLVPTEVELTRQEGRDYEPADVLLQRILAERRARWEAEQLAKLEAQGRVPLNNAWKAKYQEPAAPDTSKLPKLPEGWRWASLHQCCSVERGRFSVRPRNDPRYYGGTIPFVQIGDLPRDGGTISAYTQTLNEDGLKISRMFGKGTILIAIVGATIGNTGILNFDSCCPDSLVALHSSDETLLRYAEFYLRLMKLEIRNAGYASGGQPNINLALLQPYPIPLPPANALKRIVAEVERRLSVVEEIETTVAANLKRAERLRQSILQRAFSGKLVPQDPDDEPASILLERIRAERAASADLQSASKRRTIQKPQPTLPL